MSEEIIAPKVVDSELEDFLNGTSDKKYVTSIEINNYSNEVFLITQDPIEGKKIEKSTFKPFLYMMELSPSLKEKFYKGDVNYRSKAMLKYGISIKKLTTTAEDKQYVERLDKGYKYLVQTNKTYNDLLLFFKEGGLDSFQYKKTFVKLSLQEQFLIQTGIRLFKGFEFYNDIHKLYFDIETSGLNPECERVFLIGIKDNKGYERILEVEKPEDDESEVKMIVEFFKVVDELNPAIIAGYNSENFDFHFILKRLELLGFDVKTIKTTLSTKNSIFKKTANIKLGSETEVYQQTMMWGYNVVDIYHSVRRAKAINSEIKEAGLKYITKFAEVNKPDRMYIEDGEDIFNYWYENKIFLINSENNNYKVLPNSLQKEVYDLWVNQGSGILEANVISGDLNEQLIQNSKHDRIKFISGKEIVYQYLLDDLWETEKVDTIFNESSFMVGKWLPTAFSRSSTMGGAGSWNLLMTSWSYMKNLAIPIQDTKRDFVGGISRTFMLGHLKNIVKGDYAGLYPSIQLEYNIFPKHDISNFLYRCLKYFKETRDVYKKLANTEQDPYKAKFYSTKQLPLKILNNSNFGANGSEYFYWADMDIAERITCTGRQYLRKMAKYFTRYGFQPTTCDSVTYDTPVYIKYDDNNLIDIVPICDLFDPLSKQIDEDKLRDYSKKPYKILTKNGWTNILYSYKHGTTKKIHAVRTKNRFVKATEDHSLFSGGLEISPKDIQVNDVIDIMNIPTSENEITITSELAWVYGLYIKNGNIIDNDSTLMFNSLSSEEIERLVHNLKVNIKCLLFSIKDKNVVISDISLIKFFKENFYTTYGEKKVPTVILNSNKKSVINKFLDGLSHYNLNYLLHRTIKNKEEFNILYAGLSYISHKIGVNSSLIDKEGIIKYNKNDMTDCVDNVVLENKVYNSASEYVYDISTDDGTFIAGIGGVICHNTDGMNFMIPETFNIDLATNEELSEPLLIDDVTYLGKKDNVLYKGLDAFFEKFNQEVLVGKYMKIDNDGLWEIGINLSRKNYVSFEVIKKNDKIKEKVKLVGNTIKSTNLPKYIEGFLKDGIKLLIKDKPKEFVDLYYNIITNIFYKEVTASQIASKAKVKMSIENYCGKIFVPNLIKTILHIKNRKSVKEVDDKGKEIVLNEEQIEQHIIREFGGVQYNEHIAAIIKKKKFDKLPIETIQKKINYVIKHGYHNDENIPEFLRGEKFVELFGEDVLEGLNKVNELYFSVDYLKYYNIIHKYFAIHGDKNARPKAKQGHMELIIEKDKIVNLGDMIYFVNNGDKKTHGDSSINKMGESYADIIDENNLDQIVPYNIPKYINDFNGRIEPLLVVFKKVVQDSLLVEDPNDRTYYTDEDLKLSYFTFDTYPNSKEDIDDLYQDGKNVGLYKLEDREVDFWNKVGIDPNIIFDEFTTETRNIRRTPYYDKYFELLQKIKDKNLNMIVKDYQNRHDEDDIVLIKEADKYFLSIYTKGDYVKQKELV